MKIWPKSDADLQYILDLADKYRVYFSEGVRLLIKLAPLVINTPARNKRVDRWKAMAQIASAENIPVSHIVCIFFRVNRFRLDKLLSRIETLFSRSST